MNGTHSRPSPRQPAALGRDAGFDAVAGWYDALAALVFGRSLRRAQQTALDAGLPAGAPRVLIIGGGTGWVLGQVLRRHPAARILYLEASAGMLGRSRAWLRRHLPQHEAQVEFRLGTEQDLAGYGQFDAVVAFFFFDLFTAARLRQLLAQLHATLLPGAAWLVADFGTPGRWWHRWLLALMYWFFRHTAGIEARRRPPIEAGLLRLGLRPAPAGTFFGGLVEAVVWR
ncbi:class I SAM-dependent methyltransferase [Hymenobacter weizhouensis]|uniref:class I SAM-dependent methyltransferase n=1 Tax=Hymenobacter sp. YIM 151500-1 TaxID=2987689 RepID=UPI0022268577|nr:class I SAM-dependent methyltransferase [Hymenobacter sp. YIM 151500-1]UYZ65046.1 class I SAM-dependent methyltransferase [Hymenobacter sp. YIM 151500-1]